MVTRHVKILGVEISRLGMDEVETEVKRRVTEGTGGYICFVNTHVLTESTQNPILKKALDQSWLSVADGFPLVTASKLKGDPIQSRVPGPTFMENFVRKNKIITQGMIGGAENQMEIWIKTQGYNIPSYSPPYRTFAPETALEDWNQFLNLCPNRQSPAIVWIGLGAPKQELWMNEVSKVAPQTLFLGVGAAFDFLTGHAKRAPLWMQESGLEWFHRLMGNPKRLAKRYWITNFRFLGLILKELLHESSSRSQ